MSQSVNLITATQFTQLFPHALNPVDFAAAINQLLPTIGVVNDGGLLVFLAQTSFESAQYAVLEENLNYSAQGLLTTFPSHFAPADAQDYQHNPERIANRAYANRYGNSDEASGDGWRYRGRGAIQLTFKDNYQAFANGFPIAMTLPDAIDFIITPQGAVAAAAWYWRNHGLIACDNRDGMLLATVKIQGSNASNNLRLLEYDRIAGILGIS